MPKIALDEEKNRYDGQPEEDSAEDRGGVHGNSWVERNYRDR
jgi:hypothetical protein